MRVPKPLPEDAATRLAAALRSAKTKGEFQRIQCVLLRAALGLSADKVALAIGWRPTSVRRLQARYLRQGEAALTGVGRGGRRRENLTVDQEQALLAKFEAKAERGGVLEASEVRAAYEQAVGHKVPKSTVYRMLGRHGWRKIAPRPRHPKAQGERQAEFKKNSRGWSPRP
jgi:transposase